MAVGLFVLEVAVFFVALVPFFGAHPLEDHRAIRAAASLPFGNVLRGVSFELVRHRSLCSDGADVFALERVLHHLCRTRGFLLVHYA